MGLGVDAEVVFQLSGGFLRPVELVVAAMSGFRAPARFEAIGARGHHKTTEDVQGHSGKRWRAVLVWGPYLCSDPHLGPPSPDVWT